MPFSIRPVTDADIPALARIHVQGWKDSYGGIIDQGYLDGLDVKAREKNWQEWQHNPETGLLMAFAGDHSPAGFVNFGKLRTPPPGMSPIRPLYSGEIYAIYILSAYWRQGLGRQLMAAAAGGLADLRHKSMCLWVLEKNRRGCDFYKALGGERCGKMQVEIGPTSAREVCYGWRDTQKLLANDSQ